MFCITYVLYDEFHNSGYYYNYPVTSYKLKDISKSWLQENMDKH